MSKKDLSNVTADLAQLAATLPTQRPPERGRERARPRPATPTEELLQFSLSLRKSLRQELAQLAVGADMTMRAFVLMALKDKGLDVTEDDLLDRRKRGGGLTE